MAVRCVRFADGTDVLNAGGRIYSFCARLRASWGNFPAVVRVHSGASLNTQNSTIWPSGGARKITVYEADFLVKMCIRDRSIIAFHFGYSGDSSGGAVGIP